MMGLYIDDAGGVRGRLSLGLRPRVELIDDPLDEQVRPDRRFGVCKGCRAVQLHQPELARKTVKSVNVSGPPAVSDAVTALLQFTLLR